MVYILSVGDRPFYKLRHEHHSPHFHEVVKVTESQWDFSDLFKNIYKE